ncbi:hypothetical protein JJL45_01105 [Tamlana sp. s12]|uniref:hypothetical protein n=1 Tax=Tamlana sp. s12 TaxID=1630406 RepID=UPI0007FE475C|nr:hypothetical protein [Tamlana sp. s12]OBQ57193.1 hypothetical protein VQ01_01565 [Tamlana sp. s12]QQY82624.1 hypothetical protein JJL45_01105 [Tamlana sp. s12]
MMKYLRLLLILVSTSTIAQNYIQYNQTVNYSNNNLGLTFIANEISAFRNSWENRKKREEAISKAKSQLAIIKNTYDNSTQYPDHIIDGWHLVMATDNHSYCSPAKVFIEGNQIKEFVVGNWIKLSRPFHLLSPINKGKSLITLDFNGNTDTLELYFMNDLAKPTTVDKPMESGFITFWSDSKKAKTIKIWFEKVYLGELGVQFESQPQCGEEGAIIVEVKPGKYHFKGAGRGTISWDGHVEAKEKQCLSYVLNKENKE